MLVEAGILGVLRVQSGAHGGGVGCFPQTLLGTWGLESLKAESLLALFEMSWVRAEAKFISPLDLHIICFLSSHPAPILIQKSSLFSLQKLFVGQKMRAGTSSLMFRSPPVLGTE